MTMDEQLAALRKAAQLSGTVEIIDVNYRDGFAMIPPRSIRDLWAGKLPATGRCPQCQALLGNHHIDGCKWADTIVGSNEDEWFL